MIPGWARSITSARIWQAAPASQRQPAADGGTGVRAELAGTSSGISSCPAEVTVYSTAAAAAATGPGKR
jgi:hypothetical protein